MEQQLPLPSSLAEVEALIRALYEPAPPGDISRIQDVLHRLQKSPDGWQLAQSLLTNTDDKIKFFGALTLIVKLNTESSALSEGDARELLQKLVSWLVRSLDDGSGALVVRKLCSALSTYFIHFPHLWPLCIRHLVRCLDLGHAVPVDESDPASQTNQAAVGFLTLSKLQTALWFAGSFVEDVGKTDMNSSKYNRVHESLIKNGPDVASLLAQGIDPQPGTESSRIKVQEESIKCLQSWILYAQRVSATTDVLIVPLRALVAPTLNCLANDNLYEAAVELFTDILSNYSGFLTEANYGSLMDLFESQWAQERYQVLLQGDFDFDSLQFGLLLLAYGDAKVQDLMESGDPRSQRLLSGLSGLLTASGFPVGEDKIFVPALEFWSTFVETMTDTMYSSAEEETRGWMPRAMAHVMEVVSNCWRKVQYPPVEVFASWDSTERVGFGYARKDVADLLQAVYTLSGPPLISMFADLLLQHLPSRAWAELEAAAFCLGALSDGVSDENKCDDVLGKVLASPFFELLGQAHGPIPLRLRQTGLSLIEHYSDYFERHSEHLPSALNLLFDAVGDPLLGGPSAKSISTLCSSCRSILTGELGAFLGHYSAIRSGHVIDSLAEERIVLAIASIIQSIRGESQKLQAFGQLFAQIQDDIARSCRLAANPGLLNLADPLFRRGLESSSHLAETSSPAEVALQIALRALRCLASLAKGMQDISDGPIDLDSPSPADGVRSDELVRTQNDISFAIDQVLTIFSHSGEAVETVCSIFRAGFSESEPGPFVFPPEAVTAFFVKQAITTPRIGTLLSTACSYVSSLYKGPAVHVRENLSKLVPWVIGLLQALPEPESDTELAQNSIDFINRIMTRRPEILFDLQPTSSLEFFFMFTLRVLNGRQPLPKNASAEFWTGFITVKSEDPMVQSAISGAMNHLGPLVAQSLVHNVGGNASRSELDRLSEPLKKLVAQQPSAQSWLEQALLGDGFPSSHVPRQDRSLFLKKIISLRGARATNTVVREFWLVCRGSNFAYVS